MEKPMENEKPSLQEKLAEVDEEFKTFLNGLKFIKEFSETELHTFSPLDVVGSFQQRGLQRVREVGREEMVNNNDGMRKLLANMLHQCRPGMLSEDDVEQLSGINGREMRGGTL